MSLICFLFALRIWNPPLFSLKREQMWIHIVNCLSCEEQKFLQLNPRLNESKSADSRTDFGKSRFKWARKIKSESSPFLFIIIKGNVLCYGHQACKVQIRDLFCWNEHSEGMKWIAFYEIISVFIFWFEANISFLTKWLTQL